MVTLLRGGVTLLSYMMVPAPLRALAAYLKSVEKIGSLAAAPEVVRAFWVDRNVSEGTSLLLMNGARGIKALCKGACLKLNPLFIDLLKVFDGMGRVIATRVEEERLFKSWKQYKASDEPDFEAPGYDERDMYMAVKAIEVAMYTAAICALIIPLVATSAWGIQLGLLAEVTYAALCILHYMFKGHATGYKSSASGPDDEDGGDDGDARCGGKGSPQKGGGLRLDASVQRPSQRESTSPPADAAPEENTLPQSSISQGYTTVTGSMVEGAPAGDESV